MSAPAGFYDGLGASVCAAIMGLDPHRTPYDVWREMVDPDSRPNLDDNEAVEAGVMLEPAIAQWAAKKWGVEIDYRPGHLLKHPRLSFMQCHPDALVIGDSSGMEVKNRGLQTMRLYSSMEDFIDDSDRAQATEVLQCHASMAVRIEAPHWYLAVAVGGQKLLRFKIDRDPDMIAAIEEKYAMMWDYIQRGEPPPPINVEDCHKLWPAHKTNAVVVGDEFLDIYKRRAELKAAVKASEEELEFIDFRLKSAMRDAEKMVCGNKTLFTWTQNKSSDAFDAVGFKADNPGLYERYLTTKVGARVLRAKK